MTVWLMGFAFVVCAVAIGFLPAYLLRHRYGGLQPADTRAIASDVMARIGVLHGLILSLVFASSHNALKQFDNDVQAEAAATTHVFFNAERYGAPELQAASLAYAKTVVEKDWVLLRDGKQLSPEGWQAWASLLEASLALAPTDRRQQVLGERIQADIWLIQDLRQARGQDASNGLSGEFWLIAIVGLVLIAGLMFVHEINALHLGIMALYSAFTGLTLFLIFDMSHPFLGALSIDADAFERAVAAMQTGI